MNEEPGLVTHTILGALNRLYLLFNYTNLEFRFNYSALHLHV